MPDGLGATTEEIAHYEKVLNAGLRVIRVMQTSPLNRANFDKEIADLHAAYNEMENPHIGKNSPMDQWPTYLKSLVDQGVTVTILPQLQREVQSAEENLNTMKQIRGNNVKRMFPK